jgi:hypothetical protein
MSQSGASMKTINIASVLAEMARLAAAKRAIEIKEKTDV